MFSRSEIEDKTSGRNDETRSDQSSIEPGERLVLLGVLQRQRVKTFLTSSNGTTTNR